MAHGYLADYDAILTEAGDYTAKYTKLRELFGTVSGTNKEQIQTFTWAHAFAMNPWSFCCLPILLQL